jgi:predicted  nucleic acid-binding Zn-ribbon protein
MSKRLEELRLEIQKLHREQAGIGAEIRRKESELEYLRKRTTEIPKDIVRVEERIRRTEQEEKESKKEETAKNLEKKILALQRELERMK